MAIMSSQLESTLVEIGVSVRNLNQMVESYTKQQQDVPSPSERPFE
ncbi:MAG: hypothetical protein WBD47_22425 [Phormidesmis sp.]